MQILLLFIKRILLSAVLTYGFYVGLSLFAIGTNASEYTLVWLALALGSVAGFSIPMGSKEIFGNRGITRIVAGAIGFCVLAALFFGGGMFLKKINHDRYVTQWQDSIERSALRDRSSWEAMPGFNTAEAALGAYVETLGNGDFETAGRLRLGRHSQESLNSFIEEFTQGASKGTEKTIATNFLAGNYTSEFIKGGRETVDMYIAYISIDPYTFRVILIINPFTGKWNVWE